MIRVDKRKGYKYRYCWKNGNIFVIRIYIKKDK